MRKSFLLASCLLSSLSLPACAEVVLDDRASSAGSTGAGSSGSDGSSGPGSVGSGPAACAPGDHLVTFGASDSGGATLAITADDEGVYWTNSDGSVWKAEPGGASPTRLVEGIGAPESIAVRGGRIFVVDYGKGLWMIDKQSGAQKLLAKGAHGTVAVGPSALYSTNSSEVIQLFDDGGLPSILAALPGASSLTADAQHVYVKVLGVVGDPPSTRVVRLPGEGAALDEIAAIEPQDYAYGWQELAIDEASIYWVNPSQGTVMSAPKGGGAKTTLVSGLADPVAVTVSAGEVYFTVRGKDGGTDDDRAIAKVPAKGGAITYLAHGPSVSAYGVAVDARFAYWTAKYTGGPVSAACR